MKEPTGVVHLPGRAFTWAVIVQPVVHHQLAVPVVDMITADTRPSGETVFPVDDPFLSLDRCVNFRPGFRTRTRLRKMLEGPDRLQMLEYTTGTRIVWGIHLALPTAVHFQMGAVEMKPDVTPPQRDCHADGALISDIRPRRFARLAPDVAKFLVLAQQG